MFISTVYLCSGLQIRNWQIRNRHEKIMEELQCDAGWEAAEVALRGTGGAAAGEKA